MERLTVPITLIRLKEKKRRKLHPKKVAQYEQAYERGDEFPPIEVENCGTFYTIRDGRHRFIAQQNLEYRMIDVVCVRNAGVLRGIEPGTSALPCLCDRKNIDQRKRQAVFNNVQKDAGP